MSSVGKQTGIGNSVRVLVKKHIYELVFAGVHIVLTMVWGMHFMRTDDEKYFRIFGKGQDALSALHLLIASRILSILIILAFWFFIFFLFSCNSSRNFKKVFLLILSIFLAIIILTYPEMYKWESDVLTIYASVVHGNPDFWHSYFTSALYMAVMIAFVHPMALPILQTIAFAGDVAYIIEIIDTFENRVIGKTIFILSVICPPSLYLAVNPYRNCLYALLVMYYMVRIFELFRGKHDHLRIQDIVFFSCFGAVLAFWRSEGIIFIGIVPLLMFVIYGKNEIIRIIIAEAILIALYFFISFPQRYAIDKYHGKDYMMINVISMLSDVARAEKTNDDYQGYDEDYNIVNTHYDMALIKERGWLAFQLTNYFNGNELTRSMMSEDEQREFIAAGSRILIHNLTALIRGRFRHLLEAIGRLEVQSIGEYTVVYDADKISSDWSVSWKYGYSLLAEDGPVPENVHMTIYEICENAFLYYVLVMNILYSFIWMCSSVLIVGLLCEAVICRRYFFAVLFFYWLTMFAVVVMFAPDSRAAYYYPLFYQGNIFILFYFGYVSTESRVDDVYEKESSQEIAD